jgi:cyanophycin synthetase
MAIRFRPHVYWGASPLAEEPVVVLHYELAKEELSRVDSMIKAMEELFPQWLGTEPSGRAATETDDPALRLGRCVARWSLGLLNEVRGFLHDSGARATESGYELWVGFHVPELSRAVAELGFKIALNVRQPGFNPRAAEQAVDQLLQSCRAFHPDFQARILMVGARAAGIPVMQFFPRSKFWQYGWGKKSQVFMETSSNRDGYLGGIWQKDKSMTKQVLRNLGVPVPSHVLVGAEGDLSKASERIGFPCVVKPLAGGGGRGVTANIRNPIELAAAFEFARGESRDAVMVEQMINGTDHRLMVIDQKLVAVIGREPSYVIGDGKKTIRTLLAEVNSTRSSNLIKSRYLYPISVDETLERHLATQNRRLDDKLPKGERVTLRSNANRSTGGICTNKTAEAHPEVVAMAEHIAAASGLHAIGIDYLTTDIRLSPAESGGRVIEVNSVPGLSALVAAGFDEEELGLSTLGRSLGSIPVDMVIVDKQQVASRAQTLMSRALKPGHGVACGSTVKIGIFNLQAAPGNSHPWAGVQTALKNKTLESLELIATADEITRHGLPVGQLRGFTIETDAALPKAWGRVLDMAVERWKCFGENH